MYVCALFQGERKGVNKYYPPDYDPSKGGLNKWQGTHALRERAKKIHLGILVIRFEMPYNIWCDGCSNHIGMGVRWVIGVTTRCQTPGRLGTICYVIIVCGSLLEQL